jgi:hypothetical protein
VPEDAQNVDRSFAILRLCLDLYDAVVSSVDVALRCRDYAVSVAAFFWAFAARLSPGPRSTSALALARRAFARWPSRCLTLCRSSRDTWSNGCAGPPRSICSRALRSEGAEWNLPHWLASQIARSWQRSGRVELGIADLLVGCLSDFAPIAVDWAPSDVNIRRRDLKCQAMDVCCSLPLCCSRPSF